MRLWLGFLLTIVGRFARRNLFERHRRHECGPAAPRAKSVTSGRVAAFVPVIWVADLLNDLASH